MSGSWVGLVLTLAGLQVAPLPGTITGLVTKAGTAIPQPIWQARLELAGGPSSTLVLRTDANGRFVFSNLLPGEYRLKVTCDGFIRQEFPKKIIVGRGQPPPNIQFELETAPTAAGRVLDSFGEPIANIMVEALRRSYDVRGNPRMTRVATALTDDRGEYRIFWLDPGEYFLYVASAISDTPLTQPEFVFTPVYFPGVNAPEDARPLRFDIGREVRADFRLLRRLALWSVTGHTMDAVTGRPIPATIALTPSAEDPNLSRYRARSSVSGLYPGEFSMGAGTVAPGTYIVTARSGSANQELTAFQRIELRPVPFAVPPVRPPSYPLVLTLSPPRRIQGRFFIESRDPVDLREARVTLTSIDSDLPSPRSALVQADGQFTLTGVVPGNYVLDILNLSQDLYMKAARLGANDILVKPLTTETREAANALQILLGSDGGRLRVAAYDGKGEPRSGAQFVLVPDGARRDRRDQYRLAASGEDGQTTLRGIPPGRYKLFAWENLEANAYLNSDYMQAYEAFGVPVNITSGENLPVSVRWIPKE
jgi:hypothetical protein